MDIHNSFLISSSVDSHYTGALAEGVAEEEEFPGLRGDGNGFINSISIKSNQNYAWQVEVWDGSDNPICIKSFEPTDASEAGGNYYYIANDLEWSIPLTVPKETVSVAIRNNSSSEKAAYDSGNGDTLVLSLTIIK